MSVWVKGERREEYPLGEREKRRDRGWGKSQLYLDYKNYNWDNNKGSPNPASLFPHFDFHLSSRTLSNAERLIGTDSERERIEEDANE